MTEGFRIHPARVPESWPKAPSWMSYSTLMHIERCPRAWALSNAAYPDIWNGKGYPVSVGPTAVEGTVVHDAVDFLVKSFRAGGCDSVADAKAIGVLRNLGGLSAVVEERIDHSLQRLGNNPRMRMRINGLGERLRMQLPSLREQVQAFLSRLELGPSASRASVSSADRSMVLGGGAHSEVDLQSEVLGFRGVADVIAIGPQTCEIRDFKSGSRGPHHVEQVQFYAVLWAHDARRNPDGRVADKLTISYRDRDVDVPALMADELAQLYDQIKQRTEDARHAIAVHPPVAKPSREACGNCGVRHLCEEFWTAIPLTEFGQHHSHSGDVQVRLLEQAGPTTWRCEIEIGTTLARVPEAVIRVGGQLPRLGASTRLRVLSAWITRPSDEDEVGAEEPVFISVGDASEVFVLPSIMRAGSE